MQGCQTENGKLFGRNVVLEVALGCSDTVPAEADWKALAAGTSKTMDFSPNTTTSDADDTGGWVENLTTNADGTIGFEGEVRKRDRLDQFGFGNFVEYFTTEISAGRQPDIWVRVEIGPIEFQGYMVITALSTDGGTNDIVSFSTEFKVSDGRTVKVTKIQDDDAVDVTGVTVTPTSASIAAGASTTFTVNITPTDATDKTFTVTSSVPARATATISGTTVTVNAPSGATAGTANITVKSNDGDFTAVFAATVTV